MVPESVPRSVVAVIFVNLLGPYIYSVDREVGPSLARHTVSREAISRTTPGAQPLAYRLALVRQQQRGSRHGRRVDARAVGKEIVERGATAAALQAVDAAEAAVVEHNDVELLVEHHRSRDLGIHHQIGAVTDKHPDLAVRHGELGPEPAGDLVPHAGIAVLDVIGAGLWAAPQFVQFARQPAGGAYDHIA